MTTSEIVEKHYDEMLNADSLRQICREIGSKYNRNHTNVRKAFYKEKKKHDHQVLYQHAEQSGFNADQVSHYWHKGKQISAFVKPDSITYEDIRDELIQAMEEHAPEYPTIDYSEIDNPHLLVIDPADIHIGKLAREIETGDEYNIEIAKQRVLEGVAGIIHKSQGFDIEQILFVGGNDILHIDTPKRTTTSGTPQDTDGMWYDSFMEAKDLYIAILEYLITIAPVHFVFNPSNHDYTNGFFLADVIKTWFRNCESMTFDTSISHRKYYRYFENLIGTTHGDGAKQADLPLLMANEAKEDWSKSSFRYVYTHHVHHKTAKDYTGVTVESLRSPSGTDSWHHRQGYSAPKAIEGFVHSRHRGQIARLTHYFE
jgi:hypothetical protein